VPLTTPKPAPPFAADAAADVAKSAGRGAWWLIKAAITLAIGIYTAWVFRSDSWLATHYHAGEVHTGASYFLANMFNTFFYSWTYLTSGQFLTGLFHFFLPLVLVLLFAGVAASLSKK
jgi:hypothetical protein